MNNSLSFKHGSIVFFFEKKLADVVTDYFFQIYKLAI